MKAEIISIGDEMTSGQRLDTNSQWLSQQLADIGIATARHTTVADDLDDNIDVFRASSQRCDIIVATGGLGPTLDDLTRDAIAGAFGLDLELDPISLQHIEGIFSRRSRPMPDRNRVQAMMPNGSQPIHNPHGTAPGIDLVVKRPSGQDCRIFALPGVPAEMKQMWRDTVLPAIVQHGGLQGQALRFHTVKIFGIGESDVEAKLPDLIRRDRSPRVGITVSQATISLRIADYASDENQFAIRIQPTINEIASALGNLVFGSGEDELQHAIQRLLERKRLTLSALEVGPAAWVNQWMLEVNRNSSQVFAGGLAFPTIEAVGRTLGREELATASEETDDRTPNQERYLCAARATARFFGANVGLAFGPYPDIASVEQGLPMSAREITFALWRGDDEPVVETRLLGGHPDVIHHRIAKAALDVVRLALLTD